MTDEEWIQSDLTVADLRRIYEDVAIADWEREQAFWRYWSEYVIALDRQISRSELDEMVFYGLWPAAAGAVIGGLAHADKLAAEDAAWVLPYITQHLGAAEQVRALILLNDDSVVWSEKLAELLASPADWATARTLRSLPVAAWPEAETIIAASTRSNSMKAVLSKLMKTRD